MNIHSDDNGKSDKAYKERNQYGYIACIHRKSIEKS